jgi:hypothetical protein
MKVYFAKFILRENNEELCAYKVGLTKWYIAEKRFADDQYKKFTDIQILDSIYIQHDNAQTARERCFIVEGFLKCFFKKNFRLEEHFKKPDNYFNNLSGITEMFLLPYNMSEQQALQVFNDCKKLVATIFQ